MRRLRRDPACGASALEFALVLPLLLLLVLGGIDWGHYFFVEQLVTNAAREGARAGSLQTADAQGDASTVARAFLTRGGLDVSRAQVQVTLNADSVVVHVEYLTGSLTGFSELLMPAAARATAEMRR